MLLDLDKLFSKRKSVRFGLKIQEIITKLINTRRHLPETTIFTLYEAIQDNKDMRVFVLNTGRCGSTTFMRACQHLTNYTAGHESLSSELDGQRFAYSDNHIEIDSRLSWFLGSLDKRFGDSATYIHLIRNRDEVAQSLSKRFTTHHSIIRAFTNGILKEPHAKLTKEQELQVCYDYYDTVNNNIRLFLKDKSNTQTMHLESIKEDFKSFCNSIKAEGDIHSALHEFDIKHNISDNSGPNLKYRLKLFMLRLLKR